MKPHDRDRDPRTLPTAKPSDYAERHAGIILSLTFHFAFFSMLHLYSPMQIAEAKPPEPETITIDLNELESEEPAPEVTPEPTPALQPAQNLEPSLPARLNPSAQEVFQFEDQADPESLPPLEFEQTAATQGPEDEPSEEPDEGQPGEEPDTREYEEELIGAEEADDQEPTVRDELSKAIEQSLRQDRKMLREENQELGAKGSNEIAKRLRAAEIDQASNKWLSTTRGLKEGVIRNFNTSDVPGSVAKEVLDGYGIKISYKYLDGTKGQGGSYGFLNRAQTSSGTFYNRAGKGYYQVFSFGQAAIGRMMQLEREAIIKRRLDPARTRVIEIEYAIVRTTHGYDLGVKHIETVSVPFN